MSDLYGVLCLMADGEETVITCTAEDPEDALKQVRDHKNLFYGPGDGAGRWLAARQPSNTITQVRDVKPMSEWEALHD